MSHDFIMARGRRRCANCGLEDLDEQAAFPCPAGSSPEAGADMLAVAKLATLEARLRFGPDVEVLVLVYRGERPEAQCSASSDKNRRRAARALRKMLADVSGERN